MRALKTVALHVAHPQVVRKVLGLILDRNCVIDKDVTFVLTANMSDAGRQLYKWHSFGFSDKGLAFKVLFVCNGRYYLEPLDVLNSLALGYSSVQ